MRCPYCYVNKSPDGMDESVARSAIDAVMKSAVANGFPAVKLKYAGGEASLNHRLMLSITSAPGTWPARMGCSYMPRCSATEWRCHPA